jgi:hydroxymethylglutaryl-CoA reductase
MTARADIDGTRATAPGKVILLGEHAVVYGRTALAAAIDRHVTVRIHRPCDSRKSALREPQGARNKSHLAFEIEHPFVLRPSKHAAAGYDHPDPRLAEALARAAEVVGLNGTRVAASVSTDLPLAMGLGSSAALSVALVRALACFAQRRLDVEAVCAAAFEIEKIFHGFPSGIDNTVATYGGLIAFTRGTARPLATRRLLPLVVVLGRRPRRTQQTVTALRERWETSPAVCEPLFDEIDTLVTEGERAIAAGNLAILGEAMNANHEVLQRLDISTDELDVMVGLARTHGALGAKLTGGGGGGAVICLCDGDRAPLVDAFAYAGWQAFATNIGATQRGAYAGNSPGYLDAYPDRRA